MSEEIFYNFKPSYPLPVSRIAISRTIGRLSIPELDLVREIRRLFLDAVDAADSLIYMENQFFSSQAVYEALVKRMRKQNRGKLQIVIILPRNMHTHFEEISLGITQMTMIHSLRKVAKETGHSLGFYWTEADRAHGKEIQTYIHSKLLLVDDRFLSVGSANITNRSMILDRELNVSWEAEPGSDDNLTRAIRRVRVGLIAEHAGLRRAVELRRLYRPEGLVSSLDSLTESPDCRLHLYNPDNALGSNGWLRTQNGTFLAVDAGKPIIKENVFEHSPDNIARLFSRGILLLNEWVREKEREISPKN